LTLLTPLFGILFGVTLLHDQLTTRMMLGGGAITLFGMFIVLLREKRSSIRARDRADGTLPHATERGVCAADTRPSPCLQRCRRAPQPTEESPPVLSVVPASSSLASWRAAQLRPPSPKANAPAMAPPITSAPNAICTMSSPTPMNSRPMNVNRTIAAHFTMLAGKVVSPAPPIKRSSK